jgi:hypothetical protein
VRKALLERAEAKGKRSEIGNAIARALAVQALSELRDGGSNPAGRFVGDEDWMVRLTAVAALDSTLTAKDAAALKKQAAQEKNPLVAQEIARTLMKPAARKAVPARRRHG